MHLKVNCWDKKIRHIKEKKGVGRRGAGLGGLKYAILENGNNVNFVYKDLARIID